jgi:hypothetical protein
MHETSLPIGTPLTRDFIHGAVDIEQTPAGLLPHRLPAWARAQCPDAQLAMAESQPSGVRLVFQTAATAVELVVARDQARLQRPGSPPGRHIRPVHRRPPGAPGQRAGRQGAAHRHGDRRGQRRRRRSAGPAFQRPSRRGKNRRTLAAARRGDRAGGPAFRCGAVSGRGIGKAPLGASRQFDQPGFEYDASRRAPGRRWPPRAPGSIC